ncbi:MAG: hypothetical protein ACM3SS_18120, partial [Rhodospirillaceae bacterium]
TANQSSRNPLAARGTRTATKKGVGAKKTARNAVVMPAPRGAKQARKTAGPARRTAVAKKATGPLPKKVTAQKKRATRASRKPAADVGVREVQSTTPAVSVPAGGAPSGSPLRAGDESATPESANKPE